MAGNVLLLAQGVGASGGSVPGDVGRGPPGPGSEAAATTEPRGARDCLHFAKGTCRFGDRCWNRHGEADESSARRLARGTTTAPACADTQDMALCDGGSNTAGRAEPPPPDSTQGPATRQGWGAVLEAVVVERRPLVQLRPGETG
eukprot:1217483-Lingulodinium_polyedra.AAC.1